VGKTLYKYDTRNNVIEENSYYEEDGQKHIFSKTVYKYDSRNNMVEYVYYDANPELKIKRKYIYKYDSRNNKIEEAKYEFVEKFGQRVEDLRWFTQHTYVYY